ncbi:flagellar basal body protein [Acidiferrimicrobium sp. IK]|uniref:flagellar basal body rod protein FlgB n=1 Tax=Acidiferrimicrobium sp. IK TaxID=2871700 RepID=UPI0021CB6F89|nr:flagellar basal body protein [Acidiferrimicrobium sp. IK]MCU4185025.1 flagellar basal body protein [Acidiferrimicrobium sp. IK]
MSNIIGLLQFAANGLSQQQQAIAGNLANSETPGYTAQDVNFESSLQQALTSPGGGTATVTTSPDPAPAATNGNNVDTGQQLVAAQQNTLQYQTTVEMLNAQFRLIQGATGGSWS